MDTREKILAGARLVLAEKGYLNATIGQIAKRAGVARGLLHYHFKSKEDLFLKVLESIYEESFGPKALHQVAGNEPGGFARAVTHLFRDAFAASPENFRIMYECESVARHSETVRRRLLELWAVYRQQAESLMAGLRQSNVIRSEFTDGAIVTMLIGFVYGLGVQLMFEPEIIDQDGTWESLEALLRRLIGEA